MPPASTAAYHVILLLAILPHRPEVEASLEAGEEVPAFVAEAAPVIRLISLQDFAGYWTFSEYLPALLNICTSFFFLFDADPTNPDRRKVWITLYVVRWLELIAVEEEKVWELVVEKAGDWLEGERRKIVKECGLELDWWEDSVRI
ncbi:hypothetical protein OEA41_005194 [Lepraria neglecta]|uniref:Uncharacterized protein n=1 Tax=Lepraria neglecta TaxID=209136 RepID=A0AAE0DGG6_9LECA|nr:hypothetical protein OEA41_005194 [Lepraria neglecta]